jgi:hypothetical protein
LPRRRQPLRGRYNTGAYPLRFAQELSVSLVKKVFVNEGILSRMQHMIMIDPAGKLLPPPPFPLSMIETSSAGILGQSGGPIFDKNGTIWGIQSSINAYQLDLKIPVQQYYHVGVGTHTETIIGLFEEHNIKYQKSDY